MDMGEVIGLNGQGYPYSFGVVAPWNGDFLHIMKCLKIHWSTVGK